METSKQISPWQEFSTSNKVIFLVYYFLICVVPVVSIVVFVDVSTLPEFLLGFIPYGMLIFAIVTFVLLESRMKPLLERPMRLFFPFFIQACFLAYSFSFSTKDGINSIIIFSLAEFVGLLLTLVILFLSYIYKKPIAQKERVGDKFIKIFFGLFITIFFWLPAITYGYAYISGVIISQSGMFMYLGIAQFFTGVISEVLSQKEIIKNSE